MLKRYQYHFDPDNKVHVANMGPIWGRQDPDGPHVGHMNFVIWEIMSLNFMAVIIQVQTHQ